MSFYVLKDVDWRWDDEGEGRAMVVNADSPEQAVRIATEKHIAEFTGAGGITWDVGRISLVAFGDATWEDDNNPSFERLTYYPDGLNGPPDRDPASILSAIEPAGVGVETASPWRSMDSAPRDGKHSIFAIKFGPFVYSIQGTWDAHHQKWINAADREGEYLAWMPNIMLPDEFCPWTDEYKARAALKGGEQ